MTMVTLPLWMEYPPNFSRDGSPGFTADTLDAAGEFSGAVIMAPKSGNIVRIGYFAGAGTGNGDARIETVGEDGLPTGTLYGTNTNVAFTQIANAWRWLTLTAPAAVVQGDIIALKIAWVSGSLLVNRESSSSYARGFPYFLRNTGSSIKSITGHHFAIQYDDNSIPYTGLSPISNLAFSQAINTTTTPDEKGLKFTMPFSCKCVGALIRLDSEATFAIKLYDSANVLLKSKTGADASHKGAVGSSILVGFDTEVTLLAGRTYRLTLLPETATTINIYRYVVAESAIREAWPGGMAFMATERTDAGAWTDTDTQVPLMALLLSAIDSGRSPHAQSLL